MHSVSKNGEISQATQVIDHNKGSEQSHAHSAKFFKNNLFIGDLGLNTFSQYQLNDTHKKYELKAGYEVENNAGPRHFEVAFISKTVNNSNNKSLRQTGCSSALICLVSNTEISIKSSIICNN